MTERGRFYTLWRKPTTCFSSCNHVATNCMQNEIKYIKVLKLSNPLACVKQNSSPNRGHFEIKKNLIDRQNSSVHWCHLAASSLSDEHAYSKDDNYLSYVLHYTIITNPAKSQEKKKCSSAMIIGCCCCCLQAKDPAILMQNKLH